ncbi:MAG: rod shape determining protein RodA [Patescibacteria group bacterium]|nr:rod shape determining protein RodA [Patescibacteria group bacterium]
MKNLSLKHIDWVLLLFIAPILGAGLITMKSFVGDTQFFNQQILWIAISFIAFLVTSFFDFKLFKSSKIISFAYLFFIGVLLLLFIFGSTNKGATSWFDFGAFSFQPVDFMKLLLIIILAKYFSRRHVEIKNIKLIFISSLYAGLPFILVFLQPDFGSAMIIFMIWLGMAMVSGISKKHLGIVFGIGALSFLFLWTFIFQDYQKARLKTFIDPLSDIQNTGYNAYQSTIAVGSGQIFGKGVGYGTQSRLKFLPEYETDFIFAAFSEEWGFVGSITILLLYLLIIWRILWQSIYGATNFEMLFGVGVAVMIMSHVIINIGMNIGLMPVTGINLPFMSYGGSHLLTSFIALGILSSMNRERRVLHRDDLKHEFLGI